MAEKFEHLYLPFVSGEPRKKPRGGGGYGERDNKHEFYREELSDLSQIQVRHRERKRKYQKYLDPSLIFKLEVNQNVQEDSFRNLLKGIDFDVISAAPDKKGYWIVFAEDEDFEKFKNKLRQYDSPDNRYKFFDAIGKLQDIPPSEKIGENLKENPFKDDDISALDVGIWRMEDHKLWDFMTKFIEFVGNCGGEITDKLVTKSFCRLRVIANKQIYSDILELSEVAYVDRPPKIKLNFEAELDPDIEEFDFGASPDENATGILVVDSGILARHPTLEHAVGDEISIATKYNKLISEDNPFDDVGHGTKVAGFALYGDIQKCKDCRSFIPELWIFSAKVMYKNEFGYAEYDERELLEHQLYRAASWIAENYTNCRVVNLSLGNPANKMMKGLQQFDLSTLIDDLSNELNLIFVVSCGNICDGDIGEFENYPDYLLDSDKTNIIDPASSALALTVGALCKNNSGQYYPSPITRTGPGYKGMVKPELVEYGGGYGSQVLTINPNWIREGRLFTLDNGTSFSTPKIAHLIAKLINEYPNYSNNMIKALLISSAEIPLNRPHLLSEINMFGQRTNEDDITNLLKIYGYGKPNLEKALKSSLNQVILMREHKIKLNDFHIYSFHLPEDFIDVGLTQLAWLRHYNLDILYILL